jgi:glutamate/tyrosine decarboxylase-like PLP-dependent enzyme
LSGETGFPREFGMDNLLSDAARRAQRYLSGLAERPVAPFPASLDGLKRLARPLQDESLDPAQVLAELDAIGSPATVGTAGGRYFGFVIGGSLPAALAANILAAAWDQNAVLEISSPIGAALEKVCRGWLTSVLGLPEQTEIGFVTGATMANFTGLAAARHALLETRGWDVEAKGLFGAPPINVIVGGEVHVSLLKALSMLGLGRGRALRVPVDGQGRRLPGEIPKIDGPTIVCIQAGNVNTGAFDPAGEIASRLRGTGAWIHVDGAFGLWAAASQSKRHLVDGLQEAIPGPQTPTNGQMSRTIAGLSLCETLVTSMPQCPLALDTSSKARLETRTSSYQRCHAARARSRSGPLFVCWVALALQIRSVAVCAHTKRFAQAFEEAGYEVLNEVDLNQVLVSFGTPEVTRKVIARVREDGTCWCGGTVWQGRAAMRISVSSWATTADDVTRSLDAILRLATETQPPA